MWSVLWISFALMLSATLSIVSAAYGSLGARDEAQIYLVFDVGFGTKDEAFFARVGAREVGLDRGLMTRLIFADEGSHTSIIENGYWVMPAGVIAALCGIQRT